MKLLAEDVLNLFHSAFAQRTFPVLHKPNRELPVMPIYGVEPMNEEQTLSKLVVALSKEIPLVC